MAFRNKPVITIKHLKMRKQREPEQQPLEGLVPGHARFGLCEARPSHATEGNGNGTRLLAMKTTGYYQQ